MRNYVIGRLIQAIPLVFAVLTINFILIHSAPGDPIDLIIGEGDVSDELIQRTRAEVGLDKPLHFQL